MKLKNFRDLMVDRLGEEEVKKIEAAAEKEAREYIEKNKDDLESFWNRVLESDPLK